MTTTTYPHSPGHKVSGPSQQAAVSMKGKADVLKERILEALNDGGDFTADEMAGKLNESVLAVRPRFSELLRFNMIEPTGLTRKNESGRSATVWRLKRN